MEWAGGGKSWYRNGERHREDGPAVKHNDGYCEWWLEGVLQRDNYDQLEEPTNP